MKLSLRNFCQKTFFFQNNNSADVCGYGFFVRWEMKASDQRAV